MSQDYLRCYTLAVVMFASDGRDEYSIEYPHSATFVRRLVSSPDSIGCVFALDICHAIPESLAIPAFRPEHGSFPTDIDTPADHRLSVQQDWTRWTA